MAIFPQFCIPACHATFPFGNPCCHVRFGFLNLGLTSTHKGGAIIYYFPNYSTRLPRVVSLFASLFGNGSWCQVAGRSSPCSRSFKYSVAFPKPSPPLRMTKFGSSRCLPFLLSPPPHSLSLNAQNPAGTLLPTLRSLTLLCI